MMRALAAVHGCGVLVPLSLNLLSCTTEDIDVPDGGAGGTVTVAAASSETSGSGGSSSNATNTSASSTTGAEMCDLSDACEPVVIATPEILEFSESDSFAGGYFSYGDGVSNEVTADEEWHVRGEVSTYSGFGFSLPCVADVSTFSGVEFSIRGDVAGQRLVLSANTTSNSVQDCDNPDRPDDAHNTCTGQCSNSEAEIELTEQAQTISLEWSDFSGGSRNDEPDPSEIVSLVWVFHWDDEASPYSVDVTVDDIRFIE